MRSLDQSLLLALRTKGHSEAAEDAVRSFSKLGEHGGLWLAIGVSGWVFDRDRRREWRTATGAVACSYVLNTVLKLIVRRRRPVLEGLPPLALTPTRLSFPSAHTATAFAGALAYSRLGLARRVLYALAGATAVSRPYLGLHYPSDVVAGAALGTAVAAAVSGGAVSGAAAGAAVSGTAAVGAVSGAVVSGAMGAVSGAATR